MNQYLTTQFVWFPEEVASLGWAGQDISPLEVERIQIQVFGVLLNQPEILNHKTYQNLMHQRLSLMLKADNPTDDQHRRAVVFGGDSFSVDITGQPSFEAECWRGKQPDRQTSLLSVGVAGSL